MRDDFSEETRRIVASRVANCCSNPDCGAVTCGPQDDPTKAVNVGVAAHVTGASPGGPRYDPLLTPEQRKHVANAIWLCQTCAKLVDNDIARYTPDLLRAWRDDAEDKARSQVGRTARPPGLEGVENRLQRIEFLHDCAKPLMGGSVFVELHRPYSPAELDHFRVLAAILNMHESDPHPALYLAGRDAYRVHQDSAGSTTSFIGTRSIAWSLNPDEDIQATTFSVMAPATDRVDFGAHLHRRGPFATLGSLDQRWLSVYVTKPLLAQIAGIGLTFNDYLVAAHPVEEFVILDMAPLTDWHEPLSEAEKAVPWVTVMLKNPEPLFNLPGADRKGWSLKFDDYTPEKIQ